MSTATHPRAYATVTGPTATFITPDGHTEPLTATGNDDIRLTIVRRAAEEARRTGTPVELVTAGDRGEHHLLVTTTGEITPVPDTAPSLEPDQPDPESAEADASLTLHLGEEVREPAQEQQSAAQAPAPEPPTRASFITHTTDSARPVTGWRGALSSLGITVKPSPAELARRDREAVVSRHWAGCRTIAVVNGKGGVGKTMTTAMLAAVYARYGGGNVLAWDNNDTRGTLGWRTEQGLYDTTVRDLLPAAPTLLDPAASVSDITRYVHHQCVDRYDVLRSNPELLATDQRIAEAEFDLLMQVAARYYRLVIFDSGNDESAQRWLRMIDSSYQLVIPTLAAPEPAESAALLLDALRQRDERSAALAAHAVVVVTQSEPARRADLDRVVDGFAPHVRAVATIPFDPALKSGPLRFEALRPATRDAWVAVAAHAAEKL
ncbi:ParA family protein [Microbacterium sulfonylureivorans]|uniref:ParA family protein n=1 Tax=Microbacterium sulfonylureivorans TaxID=2486854 RepID=UPI000FDABE1C|nr:ParA family protein [Microbacterium sulfonylureivorans]